MRLIRSDLAIIKLEYLLNTTSSLDHVSWVSISMRMIIYKIWPSRNFWNILTHRGEQEAVMDLIGITNIGIVDEDEPYTVTTVALSRLVSRDK